MSDTYGPALPPGFGGASTSADDTPKKSEHSPQADKPRTYGPSLPQGFQMRDSGTSDSSDDSGDEQKQSSSSAIGPVMPAGFVPQVSDDSGSESEQDDVIGPSMSEAGGELTAAEDFERRAALMRNKMLNKMKEAPKQREEWMTALPDKKLGASLGLQARTFRSDKRGDDGYDESWTETPSEREKREQDILEGKVPAKKRKQEAPQTSHRDKLMEQQAEAYNKKAKRGESLLEIHQKKMTEPAKKKKKEKDKKEKKSKKDKKKKEKKQKEKTEEKKPERTPFDRETDLKVNRFDDAMKKQYIKKAQGLGGRFGHGQTKYV